jgi:hypothetical protein
MKMLKVMIIGFALSIADAAIAERGSYRCQEITEQAEMYKAVLIENAASPGRLEKARIELPRATYELSKCQGSLMGHASDKVVCLNKDQHELPALYFWQMQLADGTLVPVARLYESQRPITFVCSYAN